MDTLPTEVLLSIFTHLPQKYAIGVCSTVCKNWNYITLQPSFYSTIYIYSEQYLLYLIRFIKEKKTHNHKPIANCVKRLILYYTPRKHDLPDLSIFPYLQYIDGLNIEYSPTIFYKYNYLRLHRPTKFSYCDHNSKWITKFHSVKNDLKLLRVYVTYNLFNIIPSQHEQEQFDPIQLKYIGTKNRSEMNTQSDPDTAIPIKILLLSTTGPLVNLTTLHVHFGSKQNREYMINEYVLENIHETCPSLESLTLEDFYMDIIDNDDEIIEYSMIDDKKSYEPALRLKALNINYSKFGDPYCFFYLGNKYPNLESFSFDLWYLNVDTEFVPIFEGAVINMLLQFPLLKKLSFYPKTRMDECNWVHALFVKWLYQHPTKLTHLDCTYDSIIDGSLNRRLLSHDTTRNITLDRLLVSQQLLIQPEPELLNHLTSLSVTLNSAVSFASTFLLENKNTIVVSSVLKNLNIEVFLYSGHGNTYFYDWLDIFPNLGSLKLKNCEKVMDDEYGNKGKDNDLNDVDDVNHFLYDEDYQNSYKLHQLINRRKQQLDILNKENNDTSYYQLESLELWHCNNWYHYNLNGFFKKCHQLKRLKFTHTTLVDTSHPKPEEVHFDLSHLHMEYFYIKDLFYVPKYNDLSRCLTKLYLYKNLTGYKRLFSQFFSKYSSDDPFELHVKCKYLDGFVIG
ncbi:unnamed protein product [Cunninghamella blakesleeana]